MKKLSIAKDVLLGISALFLLVAAIFSVSQKVSLLTVTSRSMEPTLKAGDTVITKKVDVSTVNQGDIIVLPVPLNPTLRYVHRVFEFSKESDEILIKTKGDANPEPDEWTMEITSKEVSKEIAVLPTSKIFNGPIGRKTILYVLFFSGIALTLTGAFLLLRRRNPASL